MAYLSIDYENLTGLTRSTCLSMGGTTTGLGAITTCGLDAHADSSKTKQLSNNLLAN